MTAGKVLERDADVRIAKLEEMLEAAWSAVCEADYENYDHVLRDFMFNEYEGSKGTPAAGWRRNGEVDPHAGKYDGERAELIKGDLTDDQLANAVYVYNHRTGLQSMAYLTAAKDRIRWLSRKLEEALAPSDDPHPDQVAALAKHIADRTGHGMSEKCESSAKWAIEWFGMRGKVICKGSRCAAVGGKGHSLECTLDHLCELIPNAGDLEREARYAGFSGHRMPDHYNDTQKAAWWQGLKAKARNCGHTGSPLTLLPCGTCNGSRIECDEEEHF